MRIGHRFIPFIALVGAATLALGACSSPTAQENETAACDAYTAYTAALDSARAELSASSTIGEIQAARDEVKAAHTTLDKAVENVDVDRLKDLNEAYDAFDKAVSDLDPNASVPEAVNSLEPQISAIEAAKQELTADIKC